MRLLIVALLAAGALVGCSGSLPRTVGNDRGGTIQWFATNEQEVFLAAQKHCSGYGRSAKITSIKAEAGGHVLFDCL